MAALVLKINYKNETRRISLEKSPTFLQILQILGQLFPNLNPDTISIKYLDDDGDYITVTSDIEVNEAILLAQQQQQKIVRLFITSNDSTSTPPPPSASQSPPNADLGFGLINSIMTNPELRKILAQQLNNEQVQKVLINFLQSLLTTTNDGLPKLASLLQSFGNSAQGENSANETRTPSQLDFNGLFGSFLPVVLAHAQQSTQDGQHRSTEAAPKASKEEETSVPSDEKPPSAKSSRKSTKLTTMEAQLAKEVEEDYKTHAAPQEPIKVTEEKPLPPTPTLSPPAPLTSSTIPHEKYLARFVKDVSIVNGTVFLPGQHFYKTWRLLNDGHVAWPIQTKLAFLAGERLSPSDAVQVPKFVNPGEEVDITVPMKAPTSPGKYLSHWRLVDPDGQPFGMRVWVDITVLEQAGATAFPYLTALSNSSLSNGSLPSSSLNNKASTSDSNANHGSGKEGEQYLSKELKSLLEMGFDRSKVLDALIRTNNDVDAAIQLLCSE